MAEVVLFVAPPTAVTAACSSLLPPNTKRSWDLNKLIQTDYSKYVLLKNDGI